MAAVGIGAFVDSGIFILLLLTSSAQTVTWWVTAVVLANLVPPVLLAPVLGWVVDRTSGRGAWASALMVSAVCAGGIAFLDSPVALVALAALQATCSVVLSAAAFRLLPTADGMDEHRASSFAVGIASVAAIGAPPLAAFAAGLGTGVAFAICAGLLVVAAVVVLRTAPRSVRVNVRGTPWHEVWLGSRSIRTVAVLRTFLPVALGVVLIASMEGVAGVFYLQAVTGSPVGYALLLSAWAVGSLAGAVLTDSRRFTLGPAASILVGGFAVAAAILVEGLVAWAPVIALVFVAGGVGNAIHNVGIRTLVYAHVPRDQQAQVWSVAGAGFSAAAALGNLLGTPDVLAPARAVIVAAGVLGVGLVVVTAGVVLARGGNLRPAEPVPDPAPPI